MKPRNRFPIVTVGEFYTRHGEKLGLTLANSAAGFNRRIKEPTINRPGLALSGFFSFFAEKRLQVLGAAEFAYLKSLPPETVRDRIRALLKRRVPSLVLARGARPTRQMLEEADAHGVSIFRTPLVTMNFINAATLALEHDFAPTRTEHGSMVDIMGVGTMIRGSSGIGKSECVLGLIERGHSLVSDDVTRLRLVEGGKVMATSPELTRCHMEVRGLGIINVTSIFGVGAVRLEKQLDLVVSLKDWQELEEVDRIGLEQEFYEVLDIPIPHITIPVRTGRDLARLVEVGALDQKLKRMGQNNALEFNRRLLNLMQNNQH